MIKNSTPLTLAEVIELTKDNESAEKIKSFAKRFTKKSGSDAEKIKEELEKLGLLKINQNHIVKIVDFSPKDASDLNKILPDISLDQDEIKKILDVIKK